MSDDPHRSGDDSSNATASPRLQGRARVLRAAGLAAVLGGVAALTAALVLPVLRIEVRAGVLPALDRTGWDLHGPALLLLAVLALALAPAAARGVAVAGAAIALAGVVVLVLAVVADLPDVGKQGFVGPRLLDGVSRAGAGAYAEVLGGVLLLAGGGLLALGLRDED